MNLTMTITEVNVLYGGEREEEVQHSSGPIAVVVQLGILEVKAVSDSDDQIRITEEVVLDSKTGAFVGDLPYKIGDTISVEVTT